MSSVDNTGCISLSLVQLISFVSQRRESAYNTFLRCSVAHSTVYLSSLGNVPSSAELMMALASITDILLANFDTANDVLGLHHNAIANIVVAVAI